MKNLKTLLAIALFPVAALAAPDAKACGMAIEMAPQPNKPKTPVQNVAAAEHSLDAGQNASAVKAVVASFPKVRDTEAGANPVETRALRVFAIAVVRSNGAVNERTAGADGPEWTPAANLAWAVQSLREIDARRPNDPAVQADLGEALSKIPGKQDEAMKLLGSLAQKDLMGSPFAYAALAKLRSDKGDSAAAEAAVKKCEEMSRSPGVCKPAKPVVAKA